MTEWEDSKDFISRKDAIDKLKEWSGGYSYIEIDTLGALVEFEKLPAADIPTKCVAKIQFDEEKLREIVEEIKKEQITVLPTTEPEDCDTCKHGYFGDSQCDNCRVRFPSHYERRTDEAD